MGAPALLAVPAYGRFIESRWLERVNVPVHMKRLSRPVRVLQLSDIHYSAEVPLKFIDEAVALGLSARPDLICLTGDFITDAWTFDPAAYSRCLKPLAQAAPVFACLGNHDGGPWVGARGGFPDSGPVREVLEGAGVTLLHNRSTVWRGRGAELQLSGVGDLYEGEIDGASAFATVDPSLPGILLAHNPDSKDLLNVHPWDLMLSGHTHGGQIALPVVGPFFAPVKDKRFISGLGPWEGRQIYVTRGIGSLAGIRVACRPEVSVLDLLPL